MSTGTIIGAVIGGVIGYFITGGNPVGAFWGASIGAGIGMAVDPIAPDVSSPGQPNIGELVVTPAKEGLVVNDVLGTTKLTGNMIFFCCDHTVAIEEPIEGGGKGGGGEGGTAVTGYKFYMTFALGLCLGPVDMIYSIYREDELVWSGELEVPESGGVESIYIEAMEVTADFYFGTTDQEANETLLSKICQEAIQGGHGYWLQPEPTDCDDDAELNLAWRGLCWVFFYDAYVGGVNRCPTMKFVVRKTPEVSGLDYPIVSGFDYNPAHAIWYIQETMIGMSSGMLDDVSFNEVAITLYSEDRGVSILCDRQLPALTYIESILSHIGGVLKPGIDGKMHLRLLRDDFSESELVVVDEGNILGDLQLERKGWEDTINEVNVEYSLREVDCCPSLDFEEGDNPETVPAHAWTRFEVTGGCPPFSWEVVSVGDGTISWPYGQERSVRWNEIYTGDDVCGQIVLRVTDDCGDIVTINVRGPGDWVLWQWTTHGNAGPRSPGTVCGIGAQGCRYCNNAVSGHSCDWTCCWQIEYIWPETGLKYVSGVPWMLCNDPDCQPEKWTIMAGPWYDACDPYQWFEPPTYPAIPWSPEDFYQYAEMVGDCIDPYGTHPGPCTTDPQCAYGWTGCKCVPQTLDIYYWGCV